MRTIGGVATPLISDVDRPSVSRPIFCKDPASYNVLVITLLYHPLGQPLSILVRRVALRS